MSYEFHVLRRFLLITCITEMLQNSDCMLDTLFLSGSVAKYKVGVKLLLQYRELFNFKKKYFYNVRRLWRTSRDF